MSAPGIANGSIRNRIYLGFAFVLALLVVQVGVALAGLDRVGQLRDDIAYRYEPPSRAAGDLERGVLRRAIALRTYAASGEARHLREYERELAMCAELLERLEDMGLDAEGRAALTEMAAVSAEHIRRGAAFLALHEGRAPPGAIGRADAQLFEAREALLERIRAFDDVQQQRLAAARARMAVLQREVRWWLLGAALLVAASLGATAFLTKRAVRRPALTLMAAAGAVEKGDYAPALALARSDGAPPRGELPVLGAAFARMADALRRREGQLVAQADEIRRHNDELAAAKEALAAKAAALEDVDRRKNEFLATLGHELRNPLAAIATAGALLQRERREEGVARRADVISRQVRHLRRLVDDLLDLSRINHGKIELRLERVDACAAVDAAIEAVREEAAAKGQSVELRRAATAVPVDVDPARLEQVLSNLLRNAVRYTPPSGAIVVAVEADGVEAIIRVGDTGMGISPDLLPRIFEPFIQGAHSERGEQGLGLGLALVRRLVEMHGGAVEARSDGEGTGTVFVVRLPLAAGGATLEATTSEPASEDPGDGRSDRRTRVLVVEDDPDLAEVTSDALETFGFDVRIEGDADAGLRACLEWRPDVALLDIGLPGRSGYELARDLRTRLPSGAMRLVAVTGYGQPEDRARAFAAGFDQHLVKPVAPGELRDEIVRLVGLTGLDAAA